MDHASSPSDGWLNTYERFQHEWKHKHANLIGEFAVHITNYKIFSRRFIHISIKTHIDNTRGGGNGFPTLVKINVIISISVVGSIRRDYISKRLHSALHQGAKMLAESDSFLFVGLSQVAIIINDRLGSMWYTLDVHTFNILDSSM